ncbi:extracellular solute-binding protein [Chelatococcus reniformis]|uniref:extracellular solute-binding protein n=1 Tax=Chelatococcus reniformis TaxID=1494448 RepID=UPI001FCEF229|nr:extracellular solute-binding protein [Chelatococcus reniformis]
MSVPLTLTRRGLVAGAGAAALVGPRQLRAEAARPAPPAVDLGQPRHGLSSFGELAYPADFAHFSYVDPAAPKGGAFSAQLDNTLGNQNFDTFNTLNIYVLRGDGAAGMNLTFDSLMVRAFDEPDAVYGLVARSAALGADGLSYRFALRPEARFHDGSPLTAADVAFSITMLKAQGHPTIAQTIRGVDAAEVDGADVVVRLARGFSRDLPLVVATLPIFSSRYYAARPFDAATLETPLASGPYRLRQFEQGRFVVFERVRDYWAQDLPVNRGRSNFDEIRYEYFRDRDVAFEGFKARTFTFREEFVSRIWATGYTFPALVDGRVKRETQPDETPSGMQGWWLNSRREIFADSRVREAVGLAFDFEWTNANIMYGLYERTTSYFVGSELAASEVPGAEEEALLAPFRGRVPDAVFGEPYLPPRSDGSGQDRKLLRRADDLLRAAGCRREGSRLLLPSGQPLVIEFLESQPTLQPHTQPFIRNLGLLGIAASFRIVDAAQFQRRSEAFDYDIIVRRFGMSPTPGELLRVLFGSQAARTPGSNNISGVASPAVDAMIDAALAAASRRQLVAACRALDRLLRAGHYWVPMWHKPSYWLAYWDIYGHPPAAPRYDRGVPDTWWSKEAAARATRDGR